MSWQKQRADDVSRLPGFSGLYAIQILSTPEIREKTVRTMGRIMIYPGSDSLLPVQYRILISLEKDTDALKLLPGDLILAASRIDHIPPPRNPGEFDYQHFMAARNIFMQTYLRSGSWRKSVERPTSPLRCMACRVQLKLLRVFDQIEMDSTLHSILAALTLGYRSDLDARTKQAFSQAGVIHVMALSGFNVAILVLALSYLFGIFDFSRAAKAARTGIIILMIWVFAFITGLSPSVTRATVMASFVLTGRLLSRQINTYNIFFASAFLLLTFSPALLTDVSFQLSFSAVLGILAFHPILDRLATFRSALAGRIWKLFTVSCAAQLATLPLTVYYFHQFPVYFWLTNLYVVPLVSVIIVLTGIFLLLSAIPPLALMIGKVLALLVEALYKAVVLAELLPFSLIEHIYITPLQAAMLFCFILTLFLFFDHKKSLILLCSLVCMFVFQTLGLARNLSINNRKIMLVADLKGRSVFGTVSRREAVFWCDSLPAQNNRALQYALANFLVENGVAGQTEYLHEMPRKDLAFSLHGDILCKFPWLGQNVVMECSGKRLVFLQDMQIFHYRSVNRLKADLVIVSRQIKPDLAAITGILSPDLLILDSSLRYGQIKNWKKACRDHGIPVWSIAEQGAYCLEFGNIKTGTQKSTGPIPSRTITGTAPVQSITVEGILLPYPP
jgi:competence protein ComEC